MPFIQLHRVLSTGEHRADVYWTAFRVQGVIVNTDKIAFFGPLPPVMPFATTETEHTDPSPSQATIQFHGEDYYIEVTETPAEIRALVGGYQLLGAPTITDLERRALVCLFDLAAASDAAMGNSLDGPDLSALVTQTDAEMLGIALTALDTLPDDRPGSTMSPTAKARWALRRLLPE